MKMIMKKVVLLAFLGLFLSMSSYAQHSSRYRSNYRRGQNYNANRYNFNHYTESGLGVYYGLRLGLSVATVNSDNSSLDYSDATTGLNLGFVAGMQLSYSVPLFLESGLYYTEKGGKGTSSSYSQKFTCNLHYLEVPIVVKYQYFVNNDFAIQPFAGGYLACGVGGKIKNYQAREAFNSFSDDTFQRFDGGLRIGCGISFQSLYMDMGYDFGLADIGHGDFDSTHTGSFMVNIGVNF